MYPSSSLSSGLLEPHGRYITLQNSETQHYAPYQDHASQQFTLDPSLPTLHSSQEHYLGVSVIVVYIGTIEINQQTQKIPMVARVSIVDYRGHVVLDTYVRPTHKIEDYRSRETGIQFHDLMNAPAFQEVQLRVSSIVKNKVLVGHCLWTFLSVLGLSHPALHTRDLALFRPMRRKLKSRVIVSLPTLVHRYMGRTVGMHYEDSLELARAAMDLFRCCERDFERIIEGGAWPCNLPPSRFAEYFT